MSLAILEEGEDKELGAPFLHFGGEGRLGHMWCDNISRPNVGLKQNGVKRSLLGTGYGVEVRGTVRGTPCPFRSPAFV
jgi:hypothetical protein